MARDRTFTSKQESRGFDQGYACAVACIVKGHGMSTETREALVANGFTSLAIAEARGVDPYDLEILGPSFKELEARPRD